MGNITSSEHNFKLIKLFKDENSRSNGFFFLAHSLEPSAEPGFWKTEFLKSDIFRVSILLSLKLPCEPRILCVPQLSAAGIKCLKKAS